MAFFASDLRVAETFGNPQVKQAIGPGQARGWADNVSGTAGQGMLQALGRSTEQQLPITFATPTAEQMWSQIDPTAGYISPVSGVPSTTGMTTAPVIGDSTTQPIEYPVDFQPMPTVVDDSVLPIPTVYGDSGDSATGMISGTGQDMSLSDAMTLGLDIAFPTKMGSVGGLLTSAFMGSNPVAGIIGTLIGNALSEEFFPDPEVEIVDKSWWGEYPTTVETVVPDLSGTIVEDLGWGDTDLSEGTMEGDYAEAGFSPEDVSFIEEGFDDDFDDDGGDWGDWGDWSW